MNISVSVSYTITARSVNSHSWLLQTISRPYTILSKAHIWPYQICSFYNSSIKNGLDSEEAGR